MHPRNRYSAQKPDFVALAKSHPPLHEHLVWKTDDYATLDFKSSSAQKELTRALLKQDFHLDVDMPVDKLIPTVPQKLNYIHWIEDLLSGGNADSIPKGEGTRGIDIGDTCRCGCGCGCLVLHTAMGVHNDTTGMHACAPCRRSPTWADQLILLIRAE